MALALADWASIATIVTGCAAIFAVGFGYWQTRQFRKQQLESLARDHYQHFLELCIAYPEFASPGDKVDAEARTFSDNTERFVQYEWFFTAGCNSLEAIFVAVGQLPHWKATAVSIVNEHRAYMLSQRYVDSQRPTGDPKFEAFVDCVLGRDVVKAGLDLKAPG